MFHLGIKGKNMLIFQSVKVELKWINVSYRRKKNYLVSYNLLYLLANYYHHKRNI